MDNRGRVVRSLGATLSRLPPPCVLLAEPHDDTRALLREYLEDVGYRVLIARTTDIALRHAHEADAIITGIGVPGSFDGVELVRKIRLSQHGRELPIIVFTAYALDAYRIQALEAGASVFLPKPSLPDVLTDALRRLIARRHQAASQFMLSRIRSRPAKPTVFVPAFRRWGWPG